MASNFTIISHRKNGSLHLKLYGDFDGSSAYELINALKSYPGGSYQIFIETSSLNTIYPFGNDVFQKNLNTLNKKFLNISFIGEHRKNFNPHRKITRFTARKI
jgi:hypothetical protein